MIHSDMHLNIYRMIHSRIRHYSSAQPLATKDYAIEESMGKCGHTGMSRVSSEDTKAL
jgi:hypothetical protein